MKLQFMLGCFLSAALQRQLLLSCYTFIQSQDVSSSFEKQNKTIEDFSLQTIHAFFETNTISFSYGRLHINRGFQTA